MPRIILPQQDEHETQLRARAMAEFGALPGLVIQNNPQVRGLMAKVGRDGKFGDPFMAAAGLRVGASDWIGWHSAPVVCACCGAASPPVARYLAWEWKAEGEEPTTAQLDYLAAVNAAGGIGVWSAGLEHGRQVCSRIMAGRGGE